MRTTQENIPQKPLFLPVTYEVWDWYLFKGKCVEIRNLGAFSAKSVVKGRDVWVSRAYSRGKFLASIDDEPLTGSVDEILSQMHFNDIIPTAASETEAKAKIMRYVKDGQNCIAFPVIMYWV